MEKMNGRLSVTNPSGSSYVHKLLHGDGPFIYGGNHSVKVQ